LSAGLCPDPTRQFTEGGIFGTRNAQDAEGKETKEKKEGKGRGEGRRRYFFLPPPDLSVIYTEIWVKLTN